MSDDLFTGTKILTGAELQDLCGFRMSRTAKFSLTRYNPPGKVGAAYIDSQGPIDIIMGPGGSGKTVASAIKPIKFICQHMPIGNDGTIRAKVTVIRDNFRSLYRTTLQSWLDWFPVALHPDFSGGQDRPACHRLKIATPRMVQGSVREVPVEIQVDFFAVGDLNFELIFKSYETSFAWATEADGLDWQAIPFFFSRTGRYPSLRDLPPGAHRPRVMAVDMNPPAPKHPLYLAAKRGSFREDFDPTGTEERSINFFQQPSGLADDAENRAGKSRADYELEMRTMPKDQSRRMVEGKVGRVKDGLPVYDEDFDRDRHVAKVQLEVLPGLPLNLGFDQGGQSGGAGQPAAYGFQVASNGQHRGLFSLSCPPGTGVERFLDQLVPILRHPRFHGVPPGVWTGDPAGFLGGDKVYGTLSWFEIVSQALGHRIDPAPTQEWTVRLEALGALLRRSINRDTPKLILCPVFCQSLIDALEGEYRFGKRHDGTYDPKPMKNMAANVAEAGQYGVLGVDGISTIAETIARGVNPSNVHSLTPRAVVQSADWNVF
jgi:hypothetical protein